MTKSGAMIHAAGLGVTFMRPGQPPVQALCDLDLSVDEGEFVAVIGSSGAGKSTLLRCLTGFVTPTRGRLLVDGTDMISCHGRDLSDLRRRVATVYQHFNLVERATAMENVLHGRLGYIGTIRGIIGLFPGHDRQMAYDTLDYLGLADRALQRVDRLSGGERQRVAIARALVQEPRIILADEPAASLDLSLTRQVLLLLQSLNMQFGLTILVNLHDIDLARSFATRVIGLRDGAVTFDATSDELTGESVESIYNGTPAQQEQSKIHAVA